MTVSELIDILMSKPIDSDVTLYHEVYCGGGDEDTWADALVMDDPNGDVIITDPRYEHTLKYRFTH